MASRIQGITEVFQAVGFQTAFHDSEVLSIELNRAAPSLTISILTRSSLWENERKSEEPVYYVARLYFHDIGDLEIGGFNYQNVIQEMLVEEVGPRLKIRFAGVFGVDCSFICERATVLSVEQTQLRLGHPFVMRQPGQEQTNG